MAERYLIALGSNQRHVRYGKPEAVLRAALARLDRKGVKLEAVSRIIASRPLGPSLRCYANAAVIVKSRLEPNELLHRLHNIEYKFGRRRRGAPWRARVLDLDIILWTGGPWSSGHITVPHVSFRTRRFVLQPACAIAGDWRDPVTGLHLRHLLARLTRPAPVPIALLREGP
ncbi:MAG TPA: 2-amino-4-hydroxy-6-hydroxymethyldihydropteridine diphosphokinase [Novosphingobium sp.]